MLNLSWGTRIAILYISFVALIGFMVILCMKQNVDLVSDDYYERELVFQEKINEMNNANALTEKISHVILPEGIQIQLPTLFKDKKVNGEILFFRPSDKSKDYKTSIQLNNKAQQLIAAKNLSKGMYKMKINWIADSKSYFTEEIIVVP
jgi:hypothetical protein